MSEHQPASETGPPAAPTAALALILALLALAGLIVGGWYLWQLHQSRRANSTAWQAMQARLDTLSTRFARLDGQRQQLRQRLSEAAQVNRDLRTQLLGLDERTRSLEGAVAKLSQRSLSGHDALLLDETEMLLRLGQARYTLFHDAAGAEVALTQAQQALATVDDPAFASVRRRIDSERQALAAAHPQQRQRQLHALAKLRQQANAWPLKSTDRKPTATSTGFWSQAQRALAGLVRIRRDADTPLILASGRLARELTQLDLAQAQAALLAGDGNSFRAALRRAEAALTNYFDTDAAAVQSARAQLATWVKQDLAQAPALGAALRELRNLRRVHQAKLAPAASRRGAEQRP